jgi:hypothetical protein
LERKDDFDLDLLQNNCIAQEKYANGDIEPQNCRSREKKKVTGREER